MYQKILVPLDGSTMAEMAVEHAKALATGCSVPEVVLLTVIEPFQGQVYRMNDEWLRRLQKEALITAEKYLSGLVDKLQLDGIHASSLVKEGYAADTILEYASQNDVDLIIMSSHGRTGVSRWVMGSVADKVVRHADTPVLVVTPAMTK